MFVIVEGIDRVGKTTLCNKLEGLGFITLKDAFGKIIAGSEREARICVNDDEQFPMYSIGKLDTAVQYIKNLHDKGYNIVADRLHLTELVYGSLDRAYVPRWEKLNKLDRMIEEMFGPDVMLVLVCPTDIKEASERAGCNLEAHHVMFVDEFAESKIKRGLTTNFNHLDGAVCEIARRTFKYDFYFASPFFRPDQVEREERLKTHLRKMGFKVFSPKESCHLAPTASAESQDKVFNDNVNAIRNSAGIFAITDTKDMGTIWEAGYGFGLNKPIIYFAETLGNNMFNLMLAKSGRAVFTDQDQVTSEALFKALFQGEKSTYKGLIE